MTGSVETIIAEAVQLPPDQPLTLAHKILSGVEPERHPRLMRLETTRFGSGSGVTMQVRSVASRRQRCFSSWIDACRDDPGVPGECGGRIPSSRGVLGTEAGGPGVEIPERGSGGMPADRPTAPALA